MFQVPPRGVGSGSKFRFDIAVNAAMTALSWMAVSFISTLPLNMGMSSLLFML